MLHIVKLDGEIFKEIRTLIIIYTFSDLMEADELRNIYHSGVTNICDYIYKFDNWDRFFMLDDTTFNGSEVFDMNYTIETVNINDTHSAICGTGKLILKTRKKSNPEENYIKNDFAETKKMLNYIYGIEGGRRHMGNSVYMEAYSKEYFRKNFELKPFNNSVAFVTKEPTPHEKQEEHIKNAKKELRDLRIEKVIFNENATIVFFGNKKKIVVKCSEMDCYSKEAAIALAYLKWDVGEEYFHYVLSALTGKKGDKVDRGRHFKPIEICDLNKDEEDK